MQPEQAKMEHKTADVNALSIKQLKALIGAAGLSTAGCVEKSDLRAKATEAQQRLASVPSTPQTPGAQTLGGYECLVKGDTSNVDLAVILLHGPARATATWRRWRSMLRIPGKRVLFAFPQAPEHPLMQTAWWQLDVMKFMTLSQQGPGGAGVAAAIRDEPVGLKECRVQMQSLIDDVCRMGGVGLDRVVLGGFSQGAITALDVALQGDRNPAGVLFMSGAPLVVDQWAQRLPSHRGMRVLMTHGASDPVLPAVASGWARDLLVQGGASVVAKNHAGGHDLGGPDVPRPSPTSSGVRSPARRRRAPRALPVAPVAEAKARARPRLPASGSPDAPVTGRGACAPRPRPSGGRGGAAATIACVPMF